MRRSDREIVDLNKIHEIVENCKVIRVGIQDSQDIYIVPLNFGYSFDSQHFKFFCHSSKAGKKIDTLKQNQRVAFEMDCEHSLVEAEKPCGYSYQYCSIIGTGVVEFLEGQDKLEALTLLMKHQTGKDFTFDEKMANSVAVFSVDPITLSAKSHIPC